MAAYPGRHIIGKQMFDHDHEHDDHGAPINVNVILTIKQDPQIPPLDIKQLLTQVLSIVTQNQQILKEIKIMDQATQDLLKKLDDTTNKIGDNVIIIAATTQTIADTDQTISTELDTLIANAAANGNTPPDVLAAFQAAADKLQGNSDKADAAVVALQAQVPVLQGIAAKGAPVVPAPPPPPTV